MLKPGRSLECKDPGLRWGFHFQYPGVAGVQSRTNPGRRGSAEPDATSLALLSRSLREKLSWCEALRKSQPRGRLDLLGRRRPAPAFKFRLGLLGVDSRLY